MIRSDGFYTNNFSTFWMSRIKEVGKDPLIISGLGFDPRSIQAAKILDKNGKAPFVLPIDFSVESSSDEDESLTEAKEQNSALLKTFNNAYDPIEIQLFDSHGRSVGARQLVDSIYKLRDIFSDYYDVIIDIGGLPRTLFAPLLSYLIDMQNDLKIKNLHVASLPEESLDGGIVSEQILEPSFMYGFRPPSSDNNKFVWIPIIGKNDPERLRKIHSKIEKDCVETCPILPFRSKNPRQTDELILSLKNVLFQEIRTFNNNIIYIDHRSPFVVYREIIELSKYYNLLLKDLPGEITVLISPIDDKTSSVGAIVAAVENKLPIMYADTISYRVESSDILFEPIDIEPIEIWVSGEAYEK